MRLSAPTGRRSRAYRRSRTRAARRLRQPATRRVVERAHYHADLTRRRYLAVDPANRLVADTLEADWNIALRALNDAKDAYDKAQSAATANLAETQKPASASWSPTSSRSGTTRPPRRENASA
jgi:hypothetical protein